jgi:hypothetical protein
MGCAGRMRYGYGEVSLNQLLLSRKQGAKKKGLEWNLSRAEFKRLTSMNCHYCGSVPNGRCYKRSSYGPYIYNGLDRIDCDRGYDLNNVVPCCETCNSIKNTMSDTVMYEHITRMIEYRGNPNLGEYSSPKLRKKFQPQGQMEEESLQIELDIQCVEE